MSLFHSRRVGRHSSFCFLLSALLLGVFSNGAAAADGRLWGKDLTGSAGSNTKNTAAYKKAAKALQNKLGEIGCLNTGASSYNDGGWGGGSQGGFGKFKAKLESDFPGVKYNATDDLATVHGYLDRYKAASWKSGHAACASVRAGPVFGKCDLPKLRQAWMKARDKDNKTVDDGILAFYQSLPNIEEHMDSYLPPETDDIKAVVALAPKGVTYDPDKIYGPVADLPSDVKRHLNAAAAGNDYSCQRCILLDAFKSLGDVATNDILQDPNNPIFMNAITFEMLEAQRDNIQQWARLRAGGSDNTAKAKLIEILSGFRGLARAKAGDKNQPHSLSGATYNSRCDAFIKEVKR